MDVCVPRSVDKNVLVGIRTISLPMFLELAQPNQQYGICFPVTLQVPLRILPEEGLKLVVNDIATENY